MNMETETEPRNLTSDFETKRSYKCSFCNKTGHNILKCHDESVGFMVREVLLACEYSIAYQPDGRYAYYLLNVLCTPKMIQLLVRELMPGNRVVNATKSLYREYYTKRAELPGAAELYRRRFEGDNRHNLIVIDENLKKIFSSQPRKFQPSCPREIEIARVIEWERISERRLDAMAAFDRLAAEFDRIETNYLAAERRLRETEDEYHRILDIMFRPKHNIEVCISLVEGAAEAGQSDTTCPICLETVLSKRCVSIDCGHLTCTGCMYKYMDSLNWNHSPICSLCRTPITRMEFTDSGESVEICNTFIA